MPEWTPTTEEIREQALWEFDADKERRAGEAFDRWLDDLRHHVWHEGWIASERYGYPDSHPESYENPYRALVGHGTPEPTTVEES